jgi:hypothetical protein
VILDIYYTYMVIPIVIVSHIPRRSALSRHRDENTVTASPLDSALAKRDARNPFRMRFYENCRVAYPRSSQFLKYNFNFAPIGRSRQPNRINSRPFFSWTSALFHFPHRATPLFATLTKTAGVYTNSSHYGTPPRPTAKRQLSISHSLVDYSDTFLHRIGPAEYSVHSAERPGSAV